MNFEFRKVSWKGAELDFKETSSHLPPHCPALVWDIEKSRLHGCSHELLNNENPNSNISSSKSEYGSAGLFVERTSLEYIFDRTRQLRTSKLYHHNCSSSQSPRPLVYNRPHSSTKTLYNQVHEHTQCPSQLRTMASSLISPTSRRPRPRHLLYHHHNHPDKAVQCHRAIRLLLSLTSLLLPSPPPLLQPRSLSRQMKGAQSSNTSPPSLHKQKRQSEL